MAGKRAEEAEPKDPIFRDADEMFEEFKGYTKSGTPLHVLTIYSIAIGLRSKTIVDIGLGRTTASLRLAAKETNGKVWSCDADAKRFGALKAYETKDWSLFLESSEKFIARVPNGIDFAMHDGAHDYYQVKMDLMALIPKMKKFGVICIHDSQQTELSGGILKAIHDVAKLFPVTYVHLPYGCGLTILRVEESAHGAIDPYGGFLENGTPETTPVSDVDGRIKTRGADSLGHWVWHKLKKKFVD